MILKYKFKEAAWIAEDGEEIFEVVDADDKIVFDNEPYYPEAVKVKWAKFIVAYVNATPILIECLEDVLAVLGHVVNTSMLSPFGVEQVHSLL
ncbi:hypothetical protein LCGC14_3001220, partial [marine sediment metagenome]